MPADIKANQREAAVPTAGDGYLNESRRPLASLLFVLPVLALYELGVALLGPQAIRNGADVWIESLLDFVGLRQALASAGFGYRDPAGLAPLAQ